MSRYDCETHWTHSSTHFPPPKHPRLVRHTNIRGVQTTNPGSARRRLALHFAPNHQRIGMSMPHPPTTLTITTGLDGSIPNALAIVSRATQRLSEWCDRGITTFNKRNLVGSIVALVMGHRLR
jgi:hypothetical protein